MTFHAVAQIADLEDSTATRVVIDDVAVALVRVGDELFAVSDRCTHADVSLSEGEVVGCTLECWLHGSAFDLRTGQPLSLPAFLPIQRFATRVTDDGVVEIDPTPLPDNPLPDNETEES